MEWMLRIAMKSVTFVCDVMLMKYRVRSNLRKASVCAYMKIDGPSPIGQWASFDPNVD